MPAPSTIDDFLALVRKSGLVEEKRFEEYVQNFRTSPSRPDKPAHLAAAMVQDGLLTQFQSEQLLLGKWRRFTIGKYKILERVGAGGMGSVYLCEHKFMRRQVAVKVLPAARADEPACLERFYREARAVAALDHPNIVRAYDIDQDDKLHFIVMEYVDGSSLQEIVSKHGPMDVHRACHYIRQAAIGLHHAHQTAGLVHRDIKPGNVLVDRQGAVKILDMGLARFFLDEEDNLSRKYDETVLGTADYLAPEQALDSHSVDTRADIYSLGATFYFLLSGGAVFPQGSVAQKLIWHQTRQPRPIRSIRPEVPAELAAVVEKMLAKDVSERYQTPAEVVAALEPWTQEPLPPPPAREMPQLCAAATRATLGMATSSAGTSLTPMPGSTSQPERPAGPGHVSSRSPPGLQADGRGVAVSPDEGVVPSLDTVTASADDSARLLFSPSVRAPKAATASEKRAPAKKSDQRSGPPARPATAAHLAQPLVPRPGELLPRPPQAGRGRRFVAIWLLAVALLVGLAAVLTWVVLNILK